MPLPTLPPEILYGILSHSTLTRKDLWSCSRVSQAIREVATAIIYSSLDIEVKSTWRHRKVEEDGEGDNNIWFIESPKEMALLKALAEDALLGAKIRTFNLHFYNPNASIRDQYLQFSSTLASFLSKNLPNLTTATLVENSITRHILSSLPSYTNLHTLTLRLAPHPENWKRKHPSTSSTTVKTLTWIVPHDYSSSSGGEMTENCWNNAVNALEIAAAAFPEVVEMTVKNAYRKDCDETPQGLPDLVGNEGRQGVVLSKLRKFRYQDHASAVERKFMLSFLRANKESLVSVAVGFGREEFDGEIRAFVKEVVEMMPGLRELVVPCFEERRWRSRVIPSWFADVGKKGMGGEVDADVDFVGEEGVRIFEWWDISCPFSADVGKR